MDKVSYREVEGILYNYKLIISQIKNNKIKLENLQMESMTAISYDEEKSSKTNKFYSATENAVISYMEKEQKLIREITLDEGKIQMIDNAMASLSDTERTILEMFYIENVEWWKVAAKVCYSEGWCKATRRAAIEKIVLSINGNESQMSHK